MFEAQAPPFAVWRVVPLVYGYGPTAIAYGIVPIDQLRIQCAY